MAKDHGSSREGRRGLRALRRDGTSKDQAARIATARRRGPVAGQCARLAVRAYEEGRKTARGASAEIGIEGRSELDQGRADRVAGARTNGE